MASTPVKSGVIITGTNPVAADIAATSYMGLDYKKIKHLNAKGKKPLMDFKAEDIEIASFNSSYGKEVSHFSNVYKYAVPSGWKSYL